MTSFVALKHASTSLANTHWPRSEFGKDDPFGRERQIAWSGNDGMAVGGVAWHGSMSCNRYPHTELIIVQSGKLILEKTGESLRASTGEAVLVEQGTAIRIAAERPANWIYCAVSSNKARSTPGLMRVDFSLALAPSSPPSSEVLLSAPPQCRSFNAYVDEGGKTRAGVWDSTPYTRKRVPHRVNELMYLLEGEVTLTDERDRALVLTQGDIAFIPRGTPCAWHSAKIVQKIYLVQEAL